MLKTKIKHFKSNWSVIFAFVFGLYQNGWYLSYHHQLSPIWKAIRCISEVLNLVSDVPSLVSDVPSIVSDVPRPSSRPPAPIPEGKWDKLLFSSAELLSRGWQPAPSSCCPWVFIMTNAQILCKQKRDKTQDEGRSWLGIHLHGSMDLVWDNNCN